jgi:hypothetical protein
MRTLVVATLVAGITVNATAVLAQAPHNPAAGTPSGTDALYSPWGSGPKMHALEWPDGTPVVGGAAEVAGTVIGNATGVAGVDVPEKAADVAHVPLPRPRPADAPKPTTDVAEKSGD